MTTAKPDWLANYVPSGPSRPGNPNWVKGKSANPAGRPKGIVDKRQRVAQVFMEDAHSIAARVVELALKGDLQAAGLVLSRIQPVLKPRAERVQFALDTTGSLVQQAENIMKAISEGELDADTGKALMDSLSSFAGLRQMDELAERIAKLEQRGASLGHRPRGGVLELEAADLSALQGVRHEHG